MGKTNSKFAGMFDDKADLPGDDNAIGRNERPTAKVGRPPGKRSDPNFEQCSVFLSKAKVKRTRRILEDQYDGKKDLSTVLDELLESFIARHG